MVRTTERILLKPGEAAEAIGVGRSKIYGLLMTKQLPSIRIGRSIRIPVDALHDWVRRQQAGGSPAPPAETSSAA